MRVQSGQRTALIISYNFPPRGERTGLRTAILAKHLSHLGWTPIVLTSAPDGTTHRDEGWASALEASGVQIFKTQPVYRIPMNSDGTLKVSSPLKQRTLRYLQQWTRQPDTFTPWIPIAMEMAERIISEHYVNVIYAAAPPFSDFIVAQELGHRYAIPFVVDYGDEWLDNPEYFYPTPIHRKKSNAMEENILKQSAMMFTTTRAMKEDILRRHRFLTHEEITIMPHGFDPDDYTGAQLVQREHCVITHYGDFVDGTSPKYFFTALKQLRAKRTDIIDQLKVRIVGNSLPSYKKQVQTMMLADAVTFIPAPERSTALHVVEESDVLWVASQRDSSAGSVVLGDCMGASKPFLVTVPDGTITSIAAETNAAYVCDYKNVTALQQTLERLFDDWKRHALPMPEPSYIAQFDRRSHTKEISRHLGMAMRL